MQRYPIHLWESELSLWSQSLQQNGYHTPQNPYVVFSVIYIILWYPGQEYWLFKTINIEECIQSIKKNKEEQSLQQEHQEPVSELLLCTFQVLFTPCVWYFMKYIQENVSELTEDNTVTFKTYWNVGLWSSWVTEHIFNTLHFPSVIASESYGHTKQAISTFLFIFFYLIASCGWYLNDNVGQRRIVLKFQYYNLKKWGKKKGNNNNKKKTQKKKNKQERKKKKSHYWTYPLACHALDVHLLCSFLWNTTVCSNAINRIDPSPMTHNYSAKDLSLLQVMDNTYLGGWK